MRISLLALLAAGALAAGAGMPAMEAFAAQPAAGGCRLSLRAEADPESFVGAGRAADAARVAGLIRDSGTNFAAAASHLCAAGVVRPTNLRPFSRLLVRNAEGAADPAIYDDAEEAPGALILEYAFAGGGAPPQAAIETALRCWRQPEGAGCSVEDVGP